MLKERQTCSGLLRWQHAPVWPKVLNSATFQPHKGFDGGFDRFPDELGLVLALKFQVMEVFQEHNPSEHRQAVEVAIEPLVLAHDVARGLQGCTERARFSIWRIHSIQPHSRFPLFRDRKRNTSALQSLSIHEALPISLSLRMMSRADFRGAPSVRDSAYGGFIKSNLIPGFHCFEIGRETRLHSSHFPYTRLFRSPCPCA